ncbi:MAG: ThuA domain-containing protein [Aureliella sp.]
MFRNKLLLPLAIMLCFSAVSNAEDLKILLVTGGCCHDYKFQTEQLQKAFKDARVDVEWKVVDDGGKGTKAQIKLYDDPDWSKGFDVVIHNECFANTTDEAYIKKITQAHKNGTNAIVIHCAMHTYRASKKDEWREFLGVTSRRHDHQSNYPVKVVAPEHPIMKEFPRDWVTPKDELYIIETVWPSATALATSNSERDESSHPCFWVNDYGKSRVFGTTYGHSNETFADETFQSVLVRGALWAAGKLENAK